MIALTKEKREELIEWIHEHIGFLKQDTKSTYARNSIISLEITLASLTAAPCGYTYNRGYHAEILDVDLNDDVAIGVDLYTAPLVPEIKFPQIVNRSEIAGNEIAREWFLRGCDWYEKEIKRLHGLGD